jgi:predicted dehydrogenase
MRINFNQQSFGRAWEIHKRLMNTTSPVVDCGVHYLDVLLQIADARPVQIRGMGARLTDAIAEDQVNFGHLQVLFEDGSIGWYEAGWGPMISETAFFVKDVMSPKGSVSILMDEGAKSADLDTHTRTSVIPLHRAQLDAKGCFVEPDATISMLGEPGLQQLCDLEQAFVLRAIKEDLDLTRHWSDPVRSLEILLAAHRSMRERRAVDF